MFPKKIIQHINHILESDTRESIKIQFRILANFRIDIVNPTLLSILPVIQMANTIRAVANLRHAAINLFQLILIQNSNLFRHNSRNHIHGLQLLKEEFARIRNIDIREIGAVVAHFAAVNSKRVIVCRNHSAFRAHVHLEFIGNVVESLARESCSSVRYHAIVCNNAICKEGVCIFNANVIHMLRTDIDA